MSIPKFEVPHKNEDAVLAEGNMFAIADGAGGYGVFADEWSRYLVKNLPEQHISCYREFENWIAHIWESFYLDKEKGLTSYDGFVQNKFYKEGSCSTLVACWIEDKMIHWIKYGDSALFIYDKQKHILVSKPEQVTDFEENPYLINWKEKPKAEAFDFGTINTDDQLIFLASDALACYLLLCYKILNGYEDEDIIELKNDASRISSQYRACVDYTKGKKNFYVDILEPLLIKTESEEESAWQMKHLLQSGAIQPDDYSIIFYDTNMTIKKCYSSW